MKVVANQEPCPAIAQLADAVEQDDGFTLLEQGCG